MLKQGIIDKLLAVIDSLSPSEVSVKDEHYVFYVKMKGDYYRYLSEVNPETDREGKPIAVCQSCVFTRWQLLLHTLFIVPVC